MHFLGKKILTQSQFMGNNLEPHFYVQFFPPPLFMMQRLYSAVSKEQGLTRTWGLYLTLSLTSDEHSRNCSPMPWLMLMLTITITINIINMATNSITTYAVDEWMDG